MQRDEREEEKEGEGEGEEGGGEGEEEMTCKKGEDYKTTEETINA